MNKYAFLIKKKPKKTQKTLLGNICVKMQNQTQDTLLNYYVFFLASLCGM